MVHDRPYNINENISRMRMFIKHESLFCNKGSCLIKHCRNIVNARSVIVTAETINSIHLPSL